MDTLKTALKLMPIARALVALDTAESQRSQDREQALVELKAFVEKYGARNSRVDQAAIQDAHDLLVRLGAMCGGLESKSALVWRHPGHPNQKVHGNRFGSYGAAKESLRRLKDDKAARERYKATARKRGAGSKAAVPTWEQARDKGAQKAKAVINKTDGKSNAAIMKENGITKGKFKLMGRDKTETGYKSVEVEGYISGNLAFTRSGDFSQLTHIPTGMSTGIPMGNRKLNDDLRILATLESAADWNFGGKHKKSVNDGISEASPYVLGARNALSEAGIL